MGKPPRITILPDQSAGRDVTVGRVLEFEVDANDNAVRARVEWRELASFRHSRTERREAWLPVDQLQPFDGEDYTAVPRTPAARADVPDVEVPPDWPSGVPAPTGDGWEKAATAWLFDHLPADFRAHDVLRGEPAVLVWMARLHLKHAYTATVRGYRTAAVELRDQLPPHVVREVDEVYRAERDRIIACGKALAAVEKALQSGCSRATL